MNAQRYTKLSPSVKGVNMLELKLICKSELNNIESLWKKLNALHYQDSRYFKHHYESFTFQERSTKFKDYDDDSIRIECLVDIDGKAQGYCISTIKDKVGEIDSLFIDEQARGCGKGKDLVENAISWMKSNDCIKIIVTVADGHESVFGFYQGIGFQPKLTTLELIDSSRD